MPLPTNYNTPDRIIRLGAKDAGLLQEGDDPTSEQYADWIGRLNDIVKLEQTQGLKLWLNADQEVVLVANQTTYVVAVGGDVSVPKPLRVIEGYYLLGETRRPLTPLSREEYTRMSNTAQAGALNNYFVDKQAYQLNVSFWMTPDAQAALGTAHLIIQQPMTDLINLTDTINFPQEWFIFLRWAFADDVSTGQPQAIIDRCAAKCSQYRNVLEDWDVEDASTSFAPDSRAAFNGSAFK